MGEEPWTVAEGISDVLRFLARRAGWALGLWLPLFALLSLLANLGAVAGPLSFFTLLMAVFCVPAGGVVGMVFSHGLTKAVRFVGWIPSGLAAMASLVVILTGGFTAQLLVPLALPFHVALISVCACIGACAAVARFTWADA